MTRYGFVTVSMKRRWRVVYSDGRRTDWLASESAAEDLVAEHAALQRGDEAAREQALADAVEASRRARERFVEDSTIEIRTVPGKTVEVRKRGRSREWEVELNQPTAVFPDGSERQFEESTPRYVVQRYIEAKALEEHPEPTARDLESSRSEARVESSHVWRCEAVLDGAARSLPDIERWTDFFPTEGVAALLNDLAAQGWSVAHVSEDRGLYSSDVAGSRSAPLTVRYMLARD